MENGTNWHVTGAVASSIETRRTPLFRTDQPFGRHVNPQSCEARNSSRSLSRSYFINSGSDCDSSQNVLVFIDSDAGSESSQNCRLRPTPTPVSTPTPQQWSKLFSLSRGKRANRTRQPVTTLWYTRQPLNLIGWEKKMTKSKISFMDYPLALDASIGLWGRP